MAKSFDLMAEAYRSQKGWAPIRERVLALDPGETTGWAFFSDHSLLAAGQIGTKTFPECIHSTVQLFDTWLGSNEPVTVVIEDYKVYSWKAQDHSWSQVHTLRYIGCILTLLQGGAWAYRNRQVNLVWQSAAQGKAFMTDERLKDWGFYRKGERHARDAVRHGATYIMFHDSEVKK